VDFQGCLPTLSVCTTSERIALWCGKGTLVIGIERNLSFLRPLLVQTCTYGMFSLGYLAQIMI
jgi:hypothetical protein